MIACACSDHGISFGIIHSTPRYEKTVYKTENVLFQRLVFCLVSECGFALLVVLNNSKRLFQKISSILKYGDDSNRMSWQELGFTLWESRGADGLTQLVLNRTAIFSDVEFKFPNHLNLEQIMCSDGPTSIFPSRLMHYTTDSYAQIRLESCSFSGINLGA